MPEFLDTGMQEMAGYITSTGSSWSGNVKTATFTVITEPFESYLERRGVIRTKKITELLRQEAKTAEGVPGARIHGGLERLSPQDGGK